MGVADGMAALGCMVWMKLEIRWKFTHIQSTVKGMRRLQGTEEMWRL